LAHSWFDMECREGRRLMREAHVFYTKIMTASELDSWEEGDSKKAEKGGGERLDRLLKCREVSRLWETIRNIKDDPQSAR
jgi:hypothetical protein